jgi:hypothetical protein
MRSFARILLVVLGLAASLREAGSAACASTCPGRPLADEAACASGPRPCASAPCCSPCGEPAVPCPLLEPTPQALIERAPVARVLPEPIAFAFPAAVPPDVVHLDAGLEAVRAGAPPGHGSRPPGRPLWLLDLRLLL